jgi:hypothetical protein
MAGMIIGTRKPKRWEKNPLYCHIVHHKSNMLMKSDLRSSNTAVHCLRY